MPQIAEYTAPVDKLQPEETGALAYARAGASIRADYNEAGQQISRAIKDVGEGVKELGQKVDDHNYFMELSHGLATHAQLMAGIDQQQNEFFKNVDPNDATAAQRFYQGTAQPLLQQWQQSFSTKRGQLWAAERVAAGTQQVLHQGTAEMSHLAGEAVLTNGMKQEEDLTNMAANNPSSLPFVMGEVDANRKALVDAAPNMTAEARAKFLGEDTERLKTKIETAAFQSLALRNPSQAQKAVDAGLFPHVDGTHTVQFIKSAEHNMKVEAEMARAAQDRADRKNSEAIASGFLNRIGDAEAKGDYTAMQGMATEVLKSTRPGGLDPHWGLTLHNAIRTMAENPDPPKGADSSINAMRDMMMTYPDEPMSKRILEGLKDGFYTPKQAAMLNNEYHQIVDDPVIKQAVQNPVVKSTLDQLKVVTGMKSDWLSGPPSEESIVAYNKASSWFMDEFKKRVRNGENPNEFLNPSATTYMMRGMDLHSMFGGSTGNNFLPPPGGGAEATPSGIERARKLLGVVKSDPTHKVGLDAEDTH